MSETLLHDELQAFETQEDYEKRLVQEEKQNKRHEAYMDSLRRVLDTYAGRHVLWEILEKSRMFVAPPSHEFETFRELGRGDMGREIIMDLEDCQLNAFTKIHTEASVREKEMNKDV